tara:strand:- start:738 stop:1202 length:465 start_codon:yes stop_codon:yes gene_type:complete
MNKKITFFVLIITLLIFSNAKSKDNGINIISDKLNIEMNERKSIFTGNVYAHNENLKLWSDKMIVYLKIDEDEIKKVLASGNVKIIRLVEGSEIYGDIANYSLKEEVIVITGNVIVKENGNQVSGNELVVDLKNSSSIMSSSDSNRVEAIILDN